MSATSVGSKAAGLRPRRLRAWVAAVGILAVAVAVGLYLLERNRVEAVARPARAAVAARRFDEARPRLAQWIALRPRAGEPHYLWARVEIASNRPQAAIDAIKRAIERGYDAGACRVLHAVLLAQAGHYNEAEPVLRPAFDQTSGPEPEIDEALTRIYLATFRLALAGQAIDRWMKSAPGDPRPYLYQNEVDRWMDAEPDVLIHNYRMALQRDPKLPEARLGLADKLRETRRTEEAEAEYATYLASNPKSVPGHVGAGQVALQRGDVEAAVSHFEEALALNPKETTALLELALIDLRQGRYASARGRLETVVAIDPYDPEVRYNYARVLKILGDETRAREETAASERLRNEHDQMNELRQALMRRPGDPDLRSAAARWLLEHGHDHEGLDWAQLILRFHPAHRPTCQLLADYYQKKGDFGMANYYRLVASPQTEAPPR